MLNGIRNMINQKKSYTEAAEIILEDTGFQNLDDIIVLGETKAEDLPEPEIEEADAPAAEEPAEDDGPDKGDSEEPTDGAEPELDADDDVLSADADDDGSKQEENPEEDDVLNGDADEETPVPESSDDEQPLPLPGNDSLPEVAGKQTGETPVSDPSSLLNVEVNMGSGTLRDVLPVPPQNAADALGGDGDSQHVDSGFGGDSTGEPEAPETPAMPKPDADDILNGDVGDLNDDETPSEPAEESSEEDDLLMSEAITLDGDGDQQPAQQPAGGDATAQQPAPAADPNAAPAAEPAPAADPNADPNAAPAPADPGADPTAADPNGDAPVEPDNGVTAAVKDKVAEAEAPVPNESNGAEEMMKKASSITKSVEDLKNMIMQNQTPSQ